MPPSPRAASVMRIPVPGRPVGWYCTNSMSFSGDQADLPGAQLDGHNALAAAVLHHKPGGEPLVVAPDGRELQRGLEERVQQVEAGLVRGEPGAFLLHPAEGTHRHAAVRLPAP